MTADQWAKVASVLAQTEDEPVIRQQALPDSITDGTPKGTPRFPNGARVTVSGHNRIWTVQFSGWIVAGLGYQAGWWYWLDHDQMELWSHESTLRLAPGNI